MPTTKTIELYTIHELPEDIREKVYLHHAEDWVQGLGWADMATCDNIDYLTERGFIPVQDSITWDINYQDSYSFRGDFDWDAFKSIYPEAEALLPTVNTWKEPIFIEGTIHDGFYTPSYDSLPWDYSIEDEDPETFPDYDAFLTMEKELDALCLFIQSKLREARHHCLDLLDAEYSYHTSEEFVLDMMDANEWTFFQDGTVFTQ